MSEITVLIVDDESRMRKLIRDFLVQKEYKILEAEDGEDAIKVFRENQEKSRITYVNSYRNSISYSNC